MTKDEARTGQRVTQMLYGDGTILSTGGVTRRVAERRVDTVPVDTQRRTGGERRTLNRDNALKVKFDGQPEPIWMTPRSLRPIA